MQYNGVYKEKQTVSRTLPIWLIVAYSFEWSEQKRKPVFFKKAAKLREKRTPRESVSSLCHLPATLYSHWSLPLNKF
jgi:hypothetical protein